MNRYYCALIFFTVLSFSSCSFGQINDRRVDELSNEENQVANLPSINFSPYLPLLEGGKALDFYLSLDESKGESKVVFKTSLSPAIRPMTLGSINNILDEYTGDNLYVVINAEKELPYLVVRYFELLLRKNNINQLAYRNVKGEALKRRFPPLVGPGSQVAKFASENPENELLSGYLISEEDAAILIDLVIDSIGRFEFIYHQSQFEKVDMINIDATKPYDKTEVYGLLKKYYADNEKKERAICINNDLGGSYQQYLEYLAGSFGFVYELRNEYCMKKYNRPWAELKNSEKADAFRQIPLVIREKW